MGADVYNDIFGGVGRSKSDCYDCDGGGAGLLVGYWRGRDWAYVLYGYCGSWGQSNRRKGQLEIR